MFNKILILFVLFSFNEISGQISNPLRFPHQDYDSSYIHSSILGLPNGDLLLFWIDGDMLFQARSIDEGLNWSNPVFINQAAIYYLTDSTDNISAAILDSGKIALVYRNAPDGLYSIIFSYDNGAIWTSPVDLPTSANPLIKRQTTEVNICRDMNNNIYFIYGRVPTFSGIYYIRSSDNGHTWSSPTTISDDLYTRNSFIFSLDLQTLMLVYEFVQNENSDIYTRLSTDGGATWSASSPLINTHLNEKRPRVIRDNSNTLWLFYELEKETPFEDFYQSDIVYIKSTDNGNTWSVPESFTQYRGLDFNCEVSLLNNKPFVSFSSGRDFFLERKNFQLYYGIAGETNDDNAPPYIQHFEHIPEIPEPLQPFTIRCYADDETGISSVKLVSSKNGCKTDTLTMYDDGLNGDSLANDDIYGIILDDLNTGDSRTYSFIIEDNDLNIAHLAGGFVFIPLDFNIQTYLFDINKLKLPINNRGVIANLGLLGGATFDNITFLFSAGFFLSGYANNGLWANGVASSSRIEDYYPGKVGVPPNDPKNNIYIVKSTDPHFGQSWQDWRYAVIMGADFYDGDGDGIYNPIDLNGNGIWDLNEDRPDMLGDVTAWCVFNDGVPFELRRFPDMKPQGIEIQQTAFASGYNLTGNIQNIVFFRYRIINKGTVTPELNDVIFGIWTDPDLGDYQDDLVGADTLLNSGFSYNQGSDILYGNNPPSFFTSILQGPVAYIPGETFIDVNGNGIYDPGIDTPLDTAYHFNGLFIGSKSFPGAKNLSANSFMHFIQSHQPVGDPLDPIQVRNFMNGKDKFGNYLDPCTWQFGNVFGVDCNEVNPLFLYSGDPITNVGWINTHPTDQRMMLNTGPFQLKENEPIDIWAAYLVGRGANALNSVTVSREISQYAIDYYKSNFTLLPVGVDDDFILLTDYHLYQNYPNPFNPVTTIRYQIPETGKVSLKIYDVLGGEVTTLVNEEKPVGSYEIQFDASQFASGVYFYRLQAGSYSSIKKMILIK